MADHRNNPLMFVPMGAWDSDRITLLRATKGSTQPRAAGKAVAIALRSALDAATYQGLEEEVLRNHEERRHGPSHRG